MHYNPATALRRSLSRLPFLFACLCFLFCESSFVAKKKPPEKPVNLNTATSEQLQQVPGIGPATADKILKMRKSYGPFKSVDDLLAIRGLGPKRLEKMRKYLIIGQAPKAPAQHTSPIPQKQVPPSSNKSLANPPAPTKTPSIRFLLDRPTNASRQDRAAK
jgi:comEA protein